MDAILLEEKISKEKISRDSCWNVLSSNLKDKENKRELEESMVYLFLLTKLLYIGLWYFTWFITLNFCFFIFYLVLSVFSVEHLVLVFGEFLLGNVILFPFYLLLVFMPYPCLSGPKDPSKWTHSHAQKNFNPAQNCDPLLPAPQAWKAFLPFWQNFCFFPSPDQNQTHLPKLLGELRWCI